jgi:hypothetical protein
LFRETRDKQQGRKRSELNLLKVRREERATRRKRQEIDVLGKADKMKDGRKATDYSRYRCS